MATDYKTLRVPKEAYDQAQADKRESETWGEFLQRCSDTPPELVKFVEADNSETDLSPVLNRLDDLEAELKTLREGLKG